MAIRVYICPVVGTGTKADPYRSKATNYHTTTSSFMPALLTGVPASSWVLTVIRDTSFTAIDADTSCDDLFQGDLPGSLNTREDLLGFLRSRTLADVPAARVPLIQAVLDKYGVVRSDLTGTTTLWRMMRRVASTLFEKDDNFASSF